MRADPTAGIFIMHHERRPSYEAFSIPYGRVCLKLGLTPNILTVLGLLTGAVAAVAFWHEWFIPGVVLMLLAALWDMLDGATARAGNLGTTFGGVLDHTVDRAGEFLVIAGIVMSGHVAAGWGLLALFAMWSSSYVRAVAESKGGLPTCAVGIAGRLEKFAIIIAGAVCEIFWPYQALTVAMIVVTVISLVTTIQRLVFTYQELQKRA
jgi:CDP-diacylglycerol--glycerol-3-phosphate 3-phosphatidyltransferase